jgi:hypothetical protein
MGVTNAGGFRVADDRNASRTGRRLFFFAGMGSIDAKDTVRAESRKRNCPEASFSPSDGKLYRICIAI